MILYALSIFLSAFLLFQVQPIIAKVILPWFGGSAAVWTTCMLFFQTVLLLGYVYAHWLYHRVRGRGQARLHSALLAASLLALPVLPNPRWRTAAAVDPSWRILALPSWMRRPVPSTVSQPGICTPSSRPPQSPM